MNMKSGTMKATHATYKGGGGRRDLEECAALRRLPLECTAFRFQVAFRHVETIDLQYDLSSFQFWDWAERTVSVEHNAMWRVSLRSSQ